jgi:exo-beta-1,3-glucanase (GH17 family)
MALSTMSTTVILQNCRSPMSSRSTAGLRLLHKKKEGSCQTTTKIRTRREEVT